MVVWGYLVYCMFVVCSFLFVCTVMDFLAVEKDRGVKFCMSVRLPCGQVFSHFGELCLAGIHGSGITSTMSYKSGSSEQHWTGLPLQYFRDELYRNRSGTVRSGVE